MVNILHSEPVGPSGNVAPTYTAALKNQGTAYTCKTTNNISNIRAYNVIWVGVSRANHTNRLIIIYNAAGTSRPVDFFANIDIKSSKVVQGNTSAL